MKRLELWLFGWVEIACGACQVLSLGYWHPHWDFSFIAWCMKRHLRTNKHDKA